MNNTIKKILAVAVVIIIAVGWYAMIEGIGSLSPIKNKINLGLDIKGGVNVVLEAQTDKTGDDLQELMEQTQAVIEQRVNQMGLSEPRVTIEGKNRIRVELPGVKDADQAIEEIGKTAQLKFTMADGSFVLDGSSVKDAGIENDTKNGGYAVSLKFNSAGANKFEKATEKALAGTVNATVDSSKTEDGNAVESNQILIWLDNDIISHPQVDEVISGGECQITGNFTQNEATNLAALIRGGSLPVALHEVSSSVQTAQIGLNALTMSIYAGFIGLLIILLIMLYGYRIMGLAADIALMLYTLLILVTMAVMGSVLTLPGIAGIILSIGMAVDGNIIIFSRIKEEIVAGKTIRAATQSGFKRALNPVIDSQVTTLIAAIILYQIGSSSVRGFAWTLMIGLIASIFTAVFITQLYLSLLSSSKTFGKNKFFGIRDDGTPAFEIRKQFHIIKHRKVYYIISIVIILTGLCFGLIKGMNYGIDFTGGTMMQFDMGKKVSTEQIDEVMTRHNINIGQMQVVFSGKGDNNVLIRTREALNTERRSVIIKDFEKTFRITQKDVLATELFGPSIGKELRTNAIKAILLSALGMLIYIKLRFKKWKYGIAAISGIVHDVYIVLTFYAVCQVTVNSPFIAGILTVVGYSINDTIVVFDRIRENHHLCHNISEEELIDKSINQTLTRSLMTSAATFIVMVPLYIMTNSTIRDFVLPLMVGIAVGAASSIFICSPLYYEFVKMKGKRKRASISDRKTGKDKYELTESRKRPERKQIEKPSESRENKTITTEEENRRNIPEIVIYEDVKVDEEPVKASANTAGKKLGNKKTNRPNKRKKSRKKKK